MSMCSCVQQAEAKATHSPRPASSSGAEQQSNYKAKGEQAAQQLEPEPSSIKTASSQPSIADMTPVSGWSRETDLMIQHGDNAQQDSTR